MRYPGYRKLELRELQLLQLGVMKNIHSVCVKNNIKYYVVAGTLLGAVRHKGFIPWDDDIDIAMMREDFERFKMIFNKEFDKDKFFLQYYDTDPNFQPALMRLCIKDSIIDLPSEYRLKHFKYSYLDIFPLDNVPDEENLRLDHSKKISKVDKLIKLRYYHIYKKDNFLSILLKKIVACFLSVIPMSYLKNKRLRIMQMYNDKNTECVCQTVSHYRYSKQVMKKEIFGNPVLLDFEDTQFYAPAKYKEYLTHLYGKNYMQLPPKEKRESPSDVYVKI